MNTIHSLVAPLMLAASAFAAPVVSLSPAPLLGNAGTFGWGFSLTNDTGSFLSVDSVQLFSPVDDPLFRFGPASNFTELFATYQFNAPTILIGPNSVYSLAYNGSDQGLAAWAFPNGFGTYGALASNVFQIQIGYSLYDDDAYSNQTGSGTMLGDAQLQYDGASSTIPEPATWLLTVSALAALGLRRRRGRDSILNPQSRPR
jgi:hypothetical protein